MPVFHYENAAHLTVHASAAERQHLADVLSYTNKQAKEAVRRHRNGRFWFLKKNSEEDWQEKLEELEAEVEVCLLKPDHGTLAGFADRLQSMGYEPGNQVQLPDFYARKLVGTSDELRYYQRECVDALIEARHAATSMPTGSGKSLMIQELVRRIGVKTVICAPTDSIAKQLLKQLTNAFGEKRVGLFGDGKKHSKKEIVVGIAASLTRAEAGDDHWNNLATAECVIFDESHMTPANNFKNIALGFGATAPFRFFFSATQFRNDGADLLLEGITGPVVYQKSFVEMVDEGFLAKPNHYSFITTSKSSFFSKNPDDMMDRHLYANKELHLFAADLANKFYAMNGEPVLILVDHIPQFLQILPRLRIKTEFAYGSLTKENKEHVPEEFRSKDNDAIVDRFNARQLPCLVGTSCVATGTDFRPTGTIINLQGGKSEIKFLQGRGRGTRLVPGKTEFNYVDLGTRVEGCDDRANAVMRHFWERQSYVEPQYKPNIIETGVVG